MTNLSRLRKRPLEADAEANARATGEIDIAGCATIAYSSELPDHPVEHLLDGNSGAGATRWISARPDSIEQLVVEFDRPQAISRLVYEVEEAERERTQEVRGGLGEQRPHVLPNPGSGIHLQPRGSDLPARKTELQSPSGQPFASHGCSQQERLRHGDPHGAPSLPVNLFVYTPRLLEPLSTRRAPVLSRKAGQPGIVKRL
jgi:hypothetical protein